MEESTGDARTKAAGFAKCMKSFEFIIVIVITQNIIEFV